MNKFKKTGLWVVSLLVAATAGIMTGSLTAKTKLTNLHLVKDHEFGGAYIGIEMDKFLSSGFAFGDSVNIYVENKYSEKDVPFLSGYYVATGDIILCGYTGYKYPHFTKANVGFIWDNYKFKEGDKVKIVLNKKAKYLALESAMSLRYTNERNDFASDEIFANFRNVTTGNIKPGVLYRSASPCDNRNNRASYTDKLCQDAGINLILNLADDDSSIAGHMAKEDFNSPYFAKLYSQKKVVPLKMKYNLQAADFAVKAAAGFKAMANSEGPYLVHCTEGKDRTGFILVVLEALCGADYEQIKNDYMITYENYYGLTEESDEEKYNAVVEHCLDEMVMFLTSSCEMDEVEDKDLSLAAEIYLYNAGMTEQEVNTLKEKLM